MVIGALVSVVDDDESVRESLPDLLREFGFAVQAFSSAEEFLASDCVGQTRCLILDIAMPGMSGPDLQRELTRRRQEIPIVSSPLTEMTPSVHACLNRVPWRVCSSHSATPLCSGRSMPLFE
jgi:FixJ family two-component response regulator